MSVLQIYTGSDQCTSPVDTKYQTAQKWQFSGGSTLVDGVSVGAEMPFLAFFLPQTIQPFKLSKHATSLLWT
jgi:hypothetical protein